MLPFHVTRWRIYQLEISTKPADPDANSSKFYGLNKTVINTCILAKDGANSVPIPVANFCRYMLQSNSKNLFFKIILAKSIQWSTVETTFPSKLISPQCYSNISFKLLNPSSWGILTIEHKIALSRISPNSINLHKKSVVSFTTCGKTPTTVWKQECTNSNILSVAVPQLASTGLPCTLTNRLWIFGSK